MTALPAVERPDGRSYRPRRLSGYIVADRYGDDSSVVVFGTHDPGRAQELADWLANYYIGPAVAAEPEPVWWRDGFENGDRVWVWDERRGRAGVWFREIVERSPEHQSAAADAAEALAAAQEATQ